MDVKPELSRELDLINADKDVWLVKVPTHIAQAWAETDFDDELGTIQLVQSTADPSKATVTFRPFEEPGKSYPLQSRHISKQTQIIGEGSSMSIEGRVLNSYELKMPIQRSNSQATADSSSDMTIMSINEVKRQNLSNKPVEGISMEWASVRKIDSKGIADKFVARPKNEVLQDLIHLFSQKDKYTFDEINSYVMQPKPHLQSILDEYTTTDTEANRKCYKLRSEFQTSKAPKRE